MNTTSLRTCFHVAIPLFALTLSSSCGIKASYDSSLKAFVGTAPATIPGKIEAESFNAAIDLSKGNSGTECSDRNNPDVDLLAASDTGAGCAIGWTKTSEVLDYYVLNRANSAREFEVELRLASMDSGSKVTLETPSGKKLGETKTYADGYVPGWQSWATRTISKVKIEPGLQIIRVKFTGEQNLNWLNFKTDTKVEGDLIAEEALKRSCAGCHDYLVHEDAINWTEIARRAASFKARLNDKVSPMPPRDVPQLLQISTAEREAILQYVKGLSEGTIGGAKPLASRDFKSKGMELVRDKMAEGAGHIWGMVFLPDDNILCSLKSGEVKIFDVESRKFTNVSGAPKSAQHGQGGLLDVGISPDFGDDKIVYFSYAKDLGGGQFTTALSQAKLVGDKLEDMKEIFVATGSNGKGEHFGGRLVIDSDGSIWLTVGERNDRNNAQRLDNHLGKVMHLTADGKAHSGNPFISGGGLAEIYSYGHRNPQGLAKNVFTGEIWETEHGPKGGDEVNRVKKGANFGWPLATYGTEYSGDYLAPGTYEGTEQPLTYWAPSIAPSGMSIYANELIPGWKGLVISGALAMTHLNLTEYKDGKKVSEERLFNDDGLRIREVEQAPTGELWYAADSGQLFRIKPKN